MVGKQIPLTQWSSTRWVTSSDTNSESRGWGCFRRESRLTGNAQDFGFWRPKLDRVTVLFLFCMKVQSVFSSLTAACGEWSARTLITGAGPSSGLPGLSHLFAFGSVSLLVPIWLPALRRHDQSQYRSSDDTPFFYWHQEGHRVIRKGGFNEMTHVISAVK